VEVGVLAAAGVAGLEQADLELLDQVWEQMLGEEEEIPQALLQHLVSFC
jgi:hypothetical protein